MDILSAITRCIRGVSISSRTAFWISIDGIEELDDPPEDDDPDPPELDPLEPPELEPPLELEPPDVELPDPLEPPVPAPPPPWLDAVLPCCGEGAPIVKAHPPSMDARKHPVTIRVPILCATPHLRDVLGSVTG